MQDDLDIIPNKRPEWQLVRSESGHRLHSLLYRDDSMKVSCEIHTPKNASSGKFGKQEVSFYIDGDDREFRTEENLMVAWGKKQIWIIKERKEDD